MKEINVMLDPGAKAPERAHEWDAGLDLFVPENITAYVKPGGSLTIDTGVHVEIPEGYVGLLKSKSGLNVKRNLTGEGVIDAGYTGSIVVKLYNHGPIPYKFLPGEKIIQLLIIKCETPTIRIVESFKETERGDAGFGSTGRKSTEASECSTCKWELLETRGRPSNDVSTAGVRIAFVCSNPISLSYGRETKRGCGFWEGN